DGIRGDLVTGVQTCVFRSATRRDLLARVGVLARQSPVTRQGTPPALDLFAGAGAEPVDAELADGMADLVPAGQLRELDLTERVRSEERRVGTGRTAQRGAG